MHSYYLFEACIIHFTNTGSNLRAVQLMVQIKLQTPWSEISVGNRDGGFQASN